MNENEAKDKLINLLSNQVQQLTILSKIELGDDVIEEIKKLKNIAYPKKELNIGQYVWLYGYTSIAQQNSGEFKIEEKEYKFDEDSGEKYPIYFVNGIWFDGRDGSPYKNNNSMYYIEI